MLKQILIVHFVCVVFFCGKSEGQKTNLLQRYLQQYFKDYTQAGVRSYTLYGNGQNGAADFNAGLPFPMEKNGRVQSLIYSTSSNPPAPPQRAAPKSSNGLIVENPWPYPGLTLMPQPMPMQMPMPMQAFPPPLFHPFGQSQFSQGHYQQLRTDTFNVPENTNSNVSVENQDVSSQPKEPSGQSQPESVILKERSGIVSQDEEGPLPNDNADDREILITSATMSF